MEWVPSYRVSFYQRLREKLLVDGIEMDLIHGDPPASRVGRKDQMTLDWATKVPNRFFTFRGIEFTHQPIGRHLRDADLLVMQQEAGLTLNYRALARSKLGGPPVALWGHGENPNPLTVNPAAEAVKTKLSRRAHWYFAYTERSRNVFIGLGIDSDRITVVQNSLDTDLFAHNAGEPTAEVAELVSAMNSRRARVGWMVSALDEWKRVPFLLETIDEVKQHVPSFEFVVLGAGSHASILADAADSRDWLHLLGPRFGADKAHLGELVDVTIHPGLAGLHVVESFASASPMITANISYHSHEIDYLQPGIDSIVLAADATPTEMARQTADLLNSASRLASMKQQCLQSAQIFSLDQMVARFSRGIHQALEQKRTK